MNERIKEIKREAEALAYEEHKANCIKNGRDPSMPHANALNMTFEKFAELIVRECAEVADNADAMRQKWEGIGKYVKEYFGIEETKGWVCPRCGVDRTKTVCPQGYTATIEGKCPMIGVAQ